MVHHLALSCLDYENFELLIHLKGPANELLFYLVLLCSGCSVRAGTQVLKNNLNSVSTATKPPMWELGLVRASPPLNILCCPVLVAVSPESHLHVRVSVSWTCTVSAVLEAPGHRNRAFLLKEGLVKSALTFADVVLLSLLTDKDLITIKKKFKIICSFWRSGLVRELVKIEQKWFHPSYALTEVIRDTSSQETVGFA